MSKDKKYLSACLQWFARNYETLRHNKEFLAEGSHRVVGHHKNKHGKYEVTIHLIGKPVSFDILPEEILAKDNWIESFSKKDIRALTYLANENLKNPVHELVGQRFVRNLNQFFFKLKHGITHEETEKSAEEISADPQIIKSLDPLDAHKIGYVTANEQIKRDKLSCH